MGNNLNQKYYSDRLLDGRKIRAIKKNNQVCFNIVGNTQPVNVGNRCKVKYKSVTRDGLAQVVEDIVEKMHGFRLSHSKTWITNCP